jgi:phosphatidylserine/phosphatidylglycerophosphate/cardiolipin synthase-like enzyme
MPTPEEQLTANWWAEGDFPVRTDSRVTYIVDGRATMLTMCIHFLKARNYIYLGNWGMTPLMELVRGKDHRAGPDGSPEQEALLAWLRAEGLQEADITFWQSHDLSVQAVLGYAVSKGVDVRALLWDCIELPIVAAHYNPKTAQEQLTQVGVTCVLDDSSRGLLHHPVESLHQKVTVVDGDIAFVGGIDPLIELDGDYDRWDMPIHPFASPLRRTHENTSPHPWHDVHAIIEGPAAGDVERNIRERWNDVVQRRHGDNSLLIPEHPPAAPLKSTIAVQLARTIPEHTYNFDPDPGIQGIAQMYANALSNAQHFIYLENQYFWIRAYTGIDLPLLGTDSPEMERNIVEIGAALRRGASVAIVLPDHPNLGRAFTDAGLARLRSEAPEAVEQGRVQAFCLGTYTQGEDGIHYRPVYVHAKVAIIDDIWTTAGSANLNNRGMRDDTEMNVATLNAGLALDLRMMLMAEHLGLVSDDDLFTLSRLLTHQQHSPEEVEQGQRIWSYLNETLSDPVVALRMMTERAQENLRRYKAKQPLQGQLLPYLTAEEAVQQGLNFREEHGWLEEPDHQD